MNDLTLENNLEFKGRGLKKSKTVKFKKLTVGEKRNIIRSKIRTVCWGMILGPMLWKSVKTYVIARKDRFRSDYGMNSESTIKVRIL